VRITDTGPAAVHGRLASLILAAAAARASVRRWLGNERRQWGARLIVGVLDQGIASGMNFAVSILLARWMPESGYGAFSVAFACFLFVSGFHTALLLDPVSVLGPARHWARLPAYFSDVVRLHCAWTAAASAAIAGAAFLIPRGRVTPALAGLAAMLPFLLLFWLVRRFCYVAGKPRLALASSMVYAPALLVTLLVLRWRGMLSSVTALLAIGLASAVASAIVWARLGLGCAMRAAAWRSALRLGESHWGYGKWLAAAALLSLGITHVQTLLAAGSMGLEAAAALRALLNFALPLAQLVTVVAVLAVPELSADYAAGRTRQVRKKGIAIMAGLAACAAAYETALVLFAEPLESALYGGKFVARWQLIPVLGLLPVFAALATGPSIVLQAMQKPQHYLIRGALTAPVGITSALLFTHWWGLTGMAASMVLTYATATLATWWLYRLYVSREEAGQQKPAVLRAPGACIAGRAEFREAAS